MADNFLERQRQEYELRKAEWLKKKRKVRIAVRNIEKPDDESL